MRNKIVVVFLAFALVASLVGASGQSESGPIKIGVAGAHSGDLASYGLPTANAAQLVAEKVNAEGGILGRQIQLVVEDDQCDPGIATNIAAKMVGEKVVAVIGHICSGATRSALSIYTGENIVAISPSATTPELTQSGEFPLFFRTIAPDDAQGQIQAKFVVETLGVKRVAILHDNGDYGQGLAEFAQAAIEAGYPDVKVVLMEGVTVGAVDYSAIVNRVGSSGAEVVIFGGYHPEASKLVGQMRTQGINIPFISGDGIKDESFIDVAGKASEGVYATGPMDTTGNPIAEEARKAHLAKYGEEPGPFFMNGYTAALAIVNAIEAAGSTDTDAIVKALRSKYVETPMGSIRFDDAGDAIGVGFAIYQVQNGVYVEL
ncbi:MAG: branched-chain amino acid ABC transporter substrate-binding protein [Alkalispirochaeta sp.]|jgi:branched-chain amino acid transport system substrate-binding protein